MKEIVLEDYNPNWKEQFKKEKDILKNALK
jgi:GrpB-like predicted nucleotidyltransferase (UPF0157 family)